MRKNTIKKLKENPLILIGAILIIGPMLIWMGSLFYYSIYPQVTNLFSESPVSGEVLDFATRNMNEINTMRIGVILAPFVIIGVILFFVGARRPKKEIEGKQIRERTPRP